MTISKTSMQSPNMLVRSDSISSDVTKILMINTPRSRVTCTFHLQGKTTLLVMEMQRSTV
jgi:hypothetical protein